MVSSDQQFTDMEPRNLPLWNLSSHYSWIYRSRRGESVCGGGGGGIGEDKIHCVEGMMGDKEEGGG